MFFIIQDGKKSSNGQWKEFRGSASKRNPAKDKSFGDYLGNFYGMGGSLVDHFQKLVSKVAGKIMKRLKRGAMGY